MSFIIPSLRHENTLEHPILYRIVLYHSEVVEADVEVSIERPSCWESPISVDEIANPIHRKAFFHNRKFSPYMLFLSILRDADKQMIRHACLTHGRACVKALSTLGQPQNSHLSLPSAALRKRRSVNTHCLLLLDRDLA